MKTDIFGMCCCVTVIAIGVFNVLSQDPPKYEPDFEIVYEDSPQILQEQPQEPRHIPEECKLDESQLSAIQFSYERGSPHDLGYSLAAIAIKESNAGKWKVNLQDPSGGLYHVTVDKALTKLGWEDTNFNRNRAIQRLINDDELSSKIAIEELEFWREKNTGQWLNVWASYNAGTRGKFTETGKKYANDIREIVSTIQDCGWVEHVQS